MRDSCDSGGTHQRRSRRSATRMFANEKLYLDEMTDLVNTPVRVCKNIREYLGCFVFIKPRSVPDRPNASPVMIRTSADSNASRHFARSVRSISKDPLSFLTRNGV